MRHMLSRVFGSQSNPTRLSRPKKCALRIEVLEDRAVPATFVADVFTDTVGSPPGHLSLREAITKANQNPGPDTIRLLPGTHQITRLRADNTNNSGDFGVFLNSTAIQTDSLTIVGADGCGSTIRGDSRSPIAGRDRLFDVFGQGKMQFLNLT